MIISNHKSQINEKKKVNNKDIKFTKITSIMTNTFDILIG